MVKSKIPFNQNYKKQPKPGQPKRGVFFHTLAGFFVSKELSDKKKEMFFTEMAMILSSGVDMHAALKIVSAEFKAPRDKETFQKLLVKVVTGSNLSDAMNETTAFAKLDISIVRIGESTGQIARVFQFLANYYNRKVKQRALISSAISYPLFVLTFALLAVGFLLNSVVPIFSSVYSRFGGDLPAMTRLVLSASGKVSLFVAVFVGLASFLLFLIFMYRTNAAWNRSLSNILLRIPVLKDTLTVNFLERFCRVMAMMTGSKVPLVDSLDLARETMTMHKHRQALKKASAGLFTGVPLWQSFQETRLFPQRVIYLVKLGEEINNLDTIFENLSQQYATIQEKNLKRLGTYLEPLLIIVVGILVGFILISIYLPMFSLGGKFV